MAWSDGQVVTSDAARSEIIRAGHKFDELTSSFRQALEIAEQKKLDEEVIARKLVSENVEMLSFLQRARGELAESHGQRIQERRRVNDGYQREVQIAEDTRRQLMDAEVSMALEMKEVDAILAQRYKDGVAAEAAQVQMNLRSGVEEASALRAVQDQLESMVQQERAKANRAQAFVEARGVAGQVGSAKSTCCSHDRDRGARTSSSSTTRRAVEVCALRGIGSCDFERRAKRGTGPCGIVGVRSRSRECGWRSRIEC